MVRIITAKLTDKILELYEGEIYTTARNTEYFWSYKHLGTNEISESKNRYIYRLCGNNDPQLVHFCPADLAARMDCRNCGPVFESDTEDADIIEREMEAGADYIGNGGASYGTRRPVDLRSVNLFATTCRGY